MANQIDEKTKGILKDNIKKALLDTDKVSGGGIANMIKKVSEGKASEISLIDGVDILADACVGELIHQGLSYFTDRAFTIGGSKSEWNKGK